MKKILDVLTEELEQAFEASGYDKKYAKVSVSNRSDLCEYQCNGAMAAAKVYKCAPIVIAEAVVKYLQGNPVFEEIIAIMPGFINIRVHGEFLCNYVKEQAQHPKLGCSSVEKSLKIIVDYGGANIAKPLHVGHLRSAIIGESIKRICTFMGHEALGDVHLGDWGLQMGLVIVGLKERQPDLIYFMKDYDGEFPVEPPFTIGELEEIYPAANAKSKIDESFKEAAREATVELQNGNKGYLALWNHILNVSVSDLKKNYDNLNVSFELWKKESDAQPYIPEMVQYMKDNGFTRMSEGALVVDVVESSDTKEIPPCMILKSDGATLYNTTDLATIVERMKLFEPDYMIYVVDKRQDLYFEQVFRCARKTKLVKEDTRFRFLGFGTMNGKDGKPFKTRDGGVMRLEDLIRIVTDAVYEKIKSNREVSEKEAKKTAAIVGLSALKYGDLSNMATKNYVFDIDRFSSFEGNTGPYILYTIVRIKSILGRAESGDFKLLPPSGKAEKDLMLAVTGFGNVVESAFEELAPHKICNYIYELANAFNAFYHDTKILTEENSQKRESYLALLEITKHVLEQSIQLLGFEAPDRM